LLTINGRYKTITILIQNDSEEWFELVTFLPSKECLTLLSLFNKKELLRHKNIVPKRIGIL